MQKYNTDAPDVYYSRDTDKALIRPPEVKKKRQPLNYIDNNQLLQYFIAWKETGSDIVPDNIARAILDICENLSKSGKFVGYTWRQEMVEDAVFSCIKFCKNFDPEKSHNPFAYLTQIAYNAFIKRISIEKLRLETISNYRDHIMDLYDIPPDEMNNEDEGKYEYIDSTAKSINRNFIKKKTALKKKTMKKNSIERFF